MARFAPNDILSLTEASVRYDLAESVGPDLLLAELLNASNLSGMGELPLAYRTAAGHPELRKLIAASHGVAADDVVITVGGMQALFLLAFILCERGDEAVTAAPLFPLARNVLEAVGAKIHTLRLSFDNSYQPDIAEFRALLSSKTRLVSLASPQNPSGVAFAPQTFRQILAIMEEKCPDAYLLVDETYREAAYGEDPVAPTALSLSTKIVSVASLSKCHGAPGLRLGWAITQDRQLREQLMLGKFNTVVSCSAIDEALALRVFEHRDKILSDRRRQLAEGLRRTSAWVQQNNGLVDWVRPDAGALCCVRLNPAVFDDAAVSRFYAALAAESVRVGNGTWFGEDARVFRLGFGLLPMPDLEAGLKLLTQALRHTARIAA